MPDLPPAPQVDPPPPPPDPQFPARNWIIAGGAGLGLVALAVVLLTLPTGEIAPGSEPRRGVPLPSQPTAQPPPPVAPTIAPATPPAPPPPPAPPARAGPPSTRPTAPTTAATASIAVVGLPRAASVRIDGIPVSRRHTAIAPGRHVLGAELPGRIPRTDTVQLKPGENYTWSPRLAPLQQQQAVASKPGAATHRSPSEPSPKRGNPDEASCQQTMTTGAWGGAYASCARAARAGSAGAARDVGLLFQRGTGVGRSDDSAAHWFGEAARAGDGESMYQLALYYERGRGVKKDQAVALDWYTRSANTGLADAEYALGQVYEKGHLGMAKDKAKALVWYRKAAAQGHKDAAVRVHDLAQ